MSAIHVRPSAGWRAALLCLAASLAGVAACGAQVTGPLTAPGVHTPLPPLSDGRLAIVGVNVVTMTSPEVLRAQTVLVRGGIIEAIGPVEEVIPPDDAQRIQGDGGWLMPGLMDMHVHLRRGDLDAYRRAGITTVRNMWGTPEVTALRQEVAAGAAHPAIFSAGPGLDGSRPVHAGSVVLTEEAAARAAVRAQVAAGWDFIKVYNSLEPRVYSAILDEARRAGITVVGHVPWALTIGQALHAGHGSVAHLTGIAEAVADGRGPAGWLAFDRSAAADVADRLADRGVWAAPTLVVLEALARNNLPAQDATRATGHQREMVAALHRAGVPLLAGTDAGIGLVAPGASMGRELGLFVEAGLSPYEALRAATVDAARFLGIEDQVGTVEVGKRADLILLAGDPLEDILTVQSPVALVQRGRRIF